ncbi:MAG: hypothetical protein WD696_16640 [Bryobacteraceae bacterium]
MAIALPKNPLPLGDRVSRGFANEDSPSRHLASGIPSLDQKFGGIPAGVIAEIAGGVSSGVTSLALRYLAEATSQGQIAAWIDPHEAFDVQSAIDAGVQLQQLLWVRCHRDIDCALRVTDLILHGGGFGLVVFDLIGVPDKALESFPLSCWFRFQRAIRNTPTALIVLANSNQAKSAAGRQMQVQREKVLWSGTDAARLLDGFVVRVAQRKPMHPGFVSLPTEATV